MKIQLKKTKRKPSPLEIQFEAQINCSKIVMAQEPYERELVFMKMPEAKDFKYTEHTYRFDFAWPLLRIVVETQGGTFIRGAHTFGKVIHSMHQKHAYAALLGWTILYGDTQQVSSLTLLNWLEDLIVERTKNGIAE